MTDILRETQTAFLSEKHPRNAMSQAGRASHDSYIASNVLMLRRRRRGGRRGTYCEAG